MTFLVLSTVLPRFCPALVPITILYVAADGAGVLYADGTINTSDERTKENINKIGVSKSGIPIYTFSYKNDDQLWSGTMAQDLLELGREDAGTIMDNGYYGVRYDMIHINMIKSS